MTLKLGNKNIFNEAVFGAIQVNYNNIYNNYGQYFTTAVGMAMVMNVIYAPNPLVAVSSCIITAGVHYITAYLEREDKISSLTKAVFDNVANYPMLTGNFALKSLLSQSAHNFIKKGITIVPNYFSIKIMDYQIEHVLNNSGKETAAVNWEWASKQVLAQPIKFAMLPENLDTKGKLILTALAGAASYGVKSLSTATQQKNFFSTTHNGTWSADLRSGLFTTPNPVKEALGKVKTALTKQFTDSGLNNKELYIQAINEAVRDFANSTDPKYINEKLPNAIASKMAAYNLDSDLITKVEELAANILWSNILRKPEDNDYAQEGMVRLATEMLSGALLTTLYGLASGNLPATLLVRAFEPLLAQEVAPHLNAVLDKSIGIEQVTLSGLRQIEGLQAPSYGIYDNYVKPLNYFALNGADVAFALMPLYNAPGGMRLALAVPMALSFGTNLILKVAVNDGKINEENADFIISLAGAGVFAGNVHTLLNDHSSPIQITMALVEAIGYLCLQSSLVDTVINYDGAKSLVPAGYDFNWDNSIALASFTAGFYVKYVIQDKFESIIVKTIAGGIGYTVIHIVKDSLQYLNDGEAKVSELLVANDWSNSTVANYNMEKAFYYHLKLLNASIDGQEFIKAAFNEAKGGMNGIELKQMHFSQIADKFKLLLLQTKVAEEHPEILGSLNAIADNYGALIGNHTTGTATNAIIAEIIVQFIQGSINAGLYEWSVTKNWPGQYGEGVMSNLGVKLDAPTNAIMKYALSIGLIEGFEAWQKIYAYNKGVIQEASEWLVTFVQELPENCRPIINEYVPQMNQSVLIGHLDILHDEI